jgi:hypothetical protein
MSYSGPICIFSRDGWTLDSWGNGAAYTLRLVANAESRSCFFQGEDATDFREQFDKLDASGGDPVALLFGDYVEAMDLDADMYG